MTSPLRAISDTPSPTSSQGRAGRTGVRFLGEAREIAVGVVLVAVLNQQVAADSRIPTPTTYLPYSLSLMTSEEKSLSPESRMKVPISGRVKTSSVGIDGEADVGRVLLVGAERRREDQVDRRLRERHDVLRIAAPVRVGALHRDFALDDVAVEQGAKLLGQVAPDAQR
jgi:hypothetical protein